VRITVDTDRCVGSAYCQRIAPTTFDLGDDGLAFVLEADVKDADAGAPAAREAEAACPAMAISIQNA
jgi:ferredoxin